jgi:putative ABC transport system substrate-binding protein
MIHRREFIAALGGAAAWPLAAGAQPKRMRRIGVLTVLLKDDPWHLAYMAALRNGLQRLGWLEGRNIRIEYGWALPDAESLQRAARELVASRPDLILAENTLGTASLLQQARTIPIVFVNIADPVGSGFVASFPRPGGNATGFLTMEPTIGGKWLELLREIAPGVTRVALLFNPATATYAEVYLNPFKAAASSLGVEGFAAPIGDIAQFESVIEGLARDRTVHLS